MKCFSDDDYYPPILHINKEFLDQTTNCSTNPVSNPYYPLICIINGHQQNGGIHALLLNLTRKLEKVNHPCTDFYVFMLHTTFEKPHSL